MKHFAQFGRLALAAAFAVVALAAMAGVGSAQEKLVFTSMSPAGSANSVFLNQWADRLNGQANGVLKVEVRDGVELANFGNVYSRTLNDVVQIGWAIQSIVAGKFPLTEVAGLPFVSPGGAPSTVALWRLFKSGALNAEYDEVVPIALIAYGAANIHFAKPLPNVDTLNGEKIGVQGRVVGQVVSALGGTPISLQSGDMYEDLQRGTIDGTILNWAGFAPYKLQEVTTYHLEGPLGQTTAMFFMSRKKYDSLSPEARKIIDANSGEATSLEFVNHFMKQAGIARSAVEASSTHKIVTLTPEQVAAWQAKTQPIIDEWSHGRKDGDKVLAQYRDLLKQ
jgi:TRAP-type C4-dicarboxylate transport system substrate-binding protein